MRIQLWECNNPDTDFKHQWYTFYGHQSVMCPFCGSLNRELDAKRKWEESPLFNWAKRKTNGR